MSTFLKETVSVLSNIKSDINFSAWLNEGKEIKSVISLLTGHAHMQLNLDAEKSQEMIEALHKHIANIKTLEVELIAQSAKETA